MTVTTEYPTIRRLREYVLFWCKMPKTVCAFPKGVPEYAKNILLFHLILNTSYNKSKKSAMTSKFCELKANLRG